MENKKGKILTVTSMKGGVGKTTTVMMLADIYAKYSKKVLVIDLDLYNGNLAFAYNVKVKNSIYNLCDDMANNRLVDGINSDYITKVNDNIHLIGAPKDPRQANKIDNRVLSTILDSLVFLYDVIIIDTNHVLNICNMIAFEHSYKIIDIFTNDSFDLQSTKSFIAICKNMEVDNLVLLLNNAIDSRKNYFSNYDIKHITKKNIDYTISSNLYLKNFDQLVMDGKLSNFDLAYKGDSKKYLENFAECMINLIDDKGGKK
ncbi:MAG: AAA family ATPase [Bacilli bacterium]|nr:AAA family ATPase [Bacilli bacterium]